ncbi:MAG: HAD family phosphatase [Bacteroidales bacterium]|nr:HAD family phosphatase [Bacteroidales bacterium]
MNHLNKKKYKLIAVDLDGTLVRSDQTISPRTLEMLKYAQSQGVKVMIASGRPTCGTIHVAEELELEKYGGYVMSFNGGEICDWATKEVLYKEILNTEVIPFLYEEAKNHDMHIITYMGREVVIEVEDNEYVRYSSMRNRMPIRKVDDFLKAIEGESIVKCMVVGEPDPLRELESELQVVLEGKAGVFRSEPFFLEIVPLGIDKAKGLKVLLERMGIEREEVIAFGDGYNDVTMIEFAGTGVAMGNATEEIKNAADMVTRSNNDDGIVFALEQLVSFT